MSGTPHDDVSGFLLDQYLAGECSGEEVARVHAWVAAHPDQAAQLADLRMVRELMAHRPVWNVQSMWENVVHRMAQMDTQEGGFRPQVARSTVQSPLSDGLRKPLLRSVVKAQPLWGQFAAAAVVLMVGLVLVLGLEHPLRPVTDALTTYATPAGQRATIMLADGSVVILNVGSRIDIPKAFGDASRTVRLHGEADFHVAHTRGAPFVVEANGIRTKVLGTEFGVRAYTTDTVQVAVRTGKVLVRQAVLGAHDVAYVTAGRVIVAQHQDVDAALSFTKGRLVLKGMKLRDALGDLDRWYDADIRLGDPSLGDLSIDAVLMSGSIGDAMEVLRNVFDVRVVRSGRTLTLFQR